MLKADLKCSRLMQATAIYRTANVSAVSATIINNINVAISSNGTITNSYVLTPGGQMGMQVSDAEHSAQRAQRAQPIACS